jgi:hypothetical protein
VSPAIRIGAMRALRFAAVVGVLCALCLSVPPPVRAAAGIDDYRSRVTQALQAVREAQAKPSAGTAASELAARVATLLPAGEQVTVGGTPVTVDDPEMERLLAEYRDAASASGRADALGALEGHLASLASAVGVPGKAVPSDPAALARLLAASSSAPSTSTSDIVRQWFEQLAQRLAEWLSGVASTPEGAVTTRTVGIAVMIAFAAVALWAAWRGAVSWRRALARRDSAPAADGLGTPVVAAAEGLPDDVGAYVETLAAQGRFREAVRALFGGAARSLSERGLIGRTRTRTNAELLSDVAPAAPEVAPPLRALTDTFEVAWYGHRDPGPAGLETARRSYREVLEAAARLHGGADGRGAEES